VTRGDRAKGAIAWGGENARLHLHVEVASQEWQGPSALWALFGHRHEAPPLVDLSQAPHLAMLLEGRCYTNNGAACPAGRQGVGLTANLSG